MDSSDYTEHSEGVAVVDRTGPPRIIGTEKTPTGKCLYAVAGVLPVETIVTSSGPNISAQSAVESMLYAGQFMEGIAGKVEQRSPNWSDLIDDPRFHKLTREGDTLEISYRDPAGEFHRVASQSVDNLLTHWESIQAKWGDEWDGIG